MKSKEEVMNKKNITLLVILVVLLLVLIMKLNNFSLELSPPNQEVKMINSEELENILEMNAGQIRTATIYFGNSNPEGVFVKTGARTFNMMNPINYNSFQATTNEMIAGEGEFQVSLLTPRGREIYQVTPFFDNNYQVVAQTDDKKDETLKNTKVCHCNVNKKYVVKCGSWYAKIKEVEVEVKGKKNTLLSYEWVASKGNGEAEFDGGSDTVDTKIPCEKDDDCKDNKKCKEACISGAKEKTVTRSDNQKASDEACKNSGYGSGKNPKSTTENVDPEITGYTCS